MKNNFCSNCGTELGNNNFCTNCGYSCQRNIYNNIDINSAKYTNNKAIVGFILSIISFSALGGMCSLPSLIFSIVGLSDAKKNDGSGKTFAIIGIVISVIGLLMVLFFLFLIFSYFGFALFSGY